MSQRKVNFLQLRTALGVLLVKSKPKSNSNFATTFLLVNIQMLEQIMTHASKIFLIFSPMSPNLS